MNNFKNVGSKLPIGGSVRTNRYDELTKQIERSRDKSQIKELREERQEEILNSYYDYIKESKELANEYNQILCFVEGITGSGKTTFLENVMDDDFYEGVLFVDRSYESYKEFSKSLLSQERQDYWNEKFGKLLEDAEFSYKIVRPQEWSQVMLSDFNLPQEEEIKYMNNIREFGQQEHYRNGIIQMLRRQKENDREIDLEAYNLSFQTMGRVENSLERQYLDIDSIMKKRYVDTCHVDNKSKGHNQGRMF